MVFELVGQYFNVSGILSTMFSVALIIMALGIGGIIIYYLLIFSKFKHKFRIKEVINDQKIIFDDLAKEYKDKEGIIWWQLYKKKEKIPVPPSEVISITNKGRKSVEAYKLPTGEYVFARDIAKIAPIPKEIIEIKDKNKKEAKLNEWKQENKIIDAFQPFTTTQRVILIEQIKKAEMRMSKKWQDYLLPIAGLGALVLIVLGLMVFYGDIAQPLLDMGDKQIQMMEVHKETANILKEIKLDIQVLKDDSVQRPVKAAPD